MAGVPLDPVSMGISAVASILGGAIAKPATPNVATSGGPLQMGDYVRIVGSPGASVSTSKVQPYSSPSPYGSEPVASYPGASNSNLMLLAVGAVVLFMMMDK